MDSTSRSGPDPPHRRGAGNGQDSVGGRGVNRRTLIRMKTIIEPFKIKMVETIRLTTPEQREQALRRAHFNLFRIPAEEVIIDLLTDSGTAAMSAEQWAGMIRGDESYAGARSWYHFERVVGDLTGMPHILPTHQGRASERILFELVGGPGTIIPSNNHF